MTAPIHDIAIVPEDVVRDGTTITEIDLDALPYGAILLSPDGVVRRYNSYEEDLAGRSRKEVIGRHFFAEVAPCTRVPQFYGVFRKGIDDGKVDEVFDFTFAFPGRPRRVRVRLLGAKDVARDGVWAFVTAL